MVGVVLGWYFEIRYNPKALANKEFILVGNT
jgi:hypothetical protein